ncbi:MAG: hypothetical protein QM541_11885 [Flavobacterium sp.]|nr:hypothetical protein [Flavobacterium sp.]
MRNVYFIRHNFAVENLTMQNEVRHILIKEKCISIHFNNDEPSDECWENEIEKTNQPEFKKAGNTFSNIKKEGAYVFAQYDSKSGEMFIGKIPAASKITYLPEINTKYKGYKCLQMQDVKSFKLSRFPILFAIRPIQQTLAKMGEKSAEIIRQIYENGKLNENLSSLSPQFQELIVQEWLRSELAGDLQIQYQLILTGKNYPSVDIIGKTLKRKVLFAQVTYHDELSNKTKFEAFEKLANEDKNQEHIYAIFSKEKSAKKGKIISKNLDEIFAELDKDKVYNTFIKNIFEGIE